MERLSTIHNFSQKLLYFVIFCCSCYLVLSVNVERLPKVGNPVILLPGDGGAQLWATINKPSTVHVYCRQKETLFNLWLNIYELVPYFIDCFVDNVRLIYDNTTRRTSAPPGVNVSCIDFGNTSGVEYLDPSQISLSKYFVGIVDALVAVGYERGVSVRGAPYDFRKSPDEAEDYFKNLTKLVEETYTLNGNQRVVLVSHSLGCLFGLYLLNHQPQSWKDKYIESFAPIAGPWGGATKIWRVIASGDNLGDFVINAVTVRDAQRSWPSIYYLAPTDKFWSPTEVLMETPKKNYTLNEFQQLLTDLDYPQGWDIAKNVANLTYDLKPPGVRVYGIHGRDVPTEEHYVYDADAPFPDHEPHMTFGQGDGTVNMRSLQGYLRWQTQQSQPVSEFVISGGEHVAILQNTTLHKYLIQTVLNNL